MMMMMIQKPNMAYSLQDGHLNKASYSLMKVKTATQLKSTHLNPAVRYFQSEMGQYC